MGSIGTFLLDVFFDVDHVYDVEYIKGSLTNTNIIYSSDNVKEVHGGGKTDALEQHGGQNKLYGELTQLHGGSGTDHFGIFGWGAIKDVERNDRVYVNNMQVTGGETPFIYDMPAAWNPWQGHLLALFNGSPQEENGATLGVKWLWDNDAIALVENYTHRFLEDGDAAIETYRQYLADKWDIASLFANLWNSVKAINFYRNNPDPETISVASSPSASPSARTAQFAAAASAPAQNIPVNKTTPFLKGNAQLTDLDTAMSSDATLRTMISNLAGRGAASLTAFDAEVRNILFRWAKVDHYNSMKICA